MKSYNITAKLMYPGNQIRQEKSKKKSLFTALLMQPSRKGRLPDSSYTKSQERSEKRRRQNAGFPNNAGINVGKPLSILVFPRKPVKAKMALGKQLVF